MDETWDSIADWYADRLRTGFPLHDFARDVLLECLPSELSGRRVLDLGCGEGTVTRALAGLGADALGIDPAPRMIATALAAERAKPTGARYAVDDGCALTTVETGAVAWVTAGLALNNVPDLDAALRSVHRVLSPGGRLAFTVPHPCFEPPDARWARGDDGRCRRVVGEYFTEGFWRSKNPEGARRAGNYHRKLSTYLNTMTGNGFAVDLVTEPEPTDLVRTAQPCRSAVPPFLVVRGRRL